MPGEQHAARDARQLGYLPELAGHARQAKAKREEFPIERK